ncbi:MAG TPA: WG repeat-containing protein, partial [Lacibacter sp.]|nr:WG repeat-containing protein [Lacibacter sp.]
MKKYLILLMLFIALDSTAQSWVKLYDYVDEFAFGLAKVSKENKYGYVNTKGELVVPLIYDEAMTLREG